MKRFLNLAKLKYFFFLLHEVNFKTLYALIWICRSKPEIDGAPVTTYDFIVGLSGPVVAFRIFDSNENDVRLLTMLRSALSSPFSF